MIRALLFLTLTLSSIVTIAQSTYSVIGKAKLGTNLPTGSLNDTHLKPGYRADIGVDFYISETVYVLAEGFFSFMSSDKDRVIRDYDKQNRIVSRNDISNHFILGLAGGVGVDIPISDNLIFSPSGSLFYGYLNPSRVEKYTQLDVNRQPLYRMEYDFYASSSAYGIRPSIEFKYAFTEKLLFSLGTSYDSYLYIDGGRKEYELLALNREIHLEDDETKINLKIRGVFNLYAGLHMRF
jgi:hypothetical protein